MGCNCCNDGGEKLDVMRISKEIKTSDKEVTLKIKKLNDRAVIPQYQHEGDAGFDFTAIVDYRDAMGEYSETVTVSPGEKYIVSTGLSMAIPKGYELQVRPRSGLAYKHGITVINSPGTVDSGYNGEIKVILLNTGSNPFDMSTGDRIAQGVINKLPSVEIREVNVLPDTSRGAGGFGSTGAK